MVGRTSTTADGESGLVRYAKPIGFAPIPIEFALSKTLLLSESVYLSSLQQRLPASWLQWYDHDRLLTAVRLARMRCKAKPAYPVSCNVAQSLHHGLAWIGKSGHGRTTCMTPLPADSSFHHRGERASVLILYSLPLTLNLCRIHL
jgi:hypothetical protein